MFDELFRRGGLSLERLRSFLRVAEVGAIARAAPRDPVRQSQYSRQIAELEDALGLALVERRGRGLALTDAGERLAAVAREAFTGLRDLAATSKDATVAASLCAGDSMLHPWVIPAIAPLLARSPNTTITVTALSDRDAIAHVVEARVDFAILRAHTMPKSVKARRLGTTGYALFVPKELRPRRTREPLQLLGEVPLAAQYADLELAAALAAQLRDANVTSAPALVCETFPHAQRAAMTGRFAAVLPTLARRDLPAREFDEVQLPGLPSITMMLAWNQKLARQRPRVAALIPRLVEALALE